MVRHNAGIPLASAHAGDPVCVDNPVVHVGSLVHIGVRRLALVALTIAIAGALASPPAAANASATRWPHSPGAPGGPATLQVSKAEAGGGDGAGGGGPTGFGSGSASNAAGASPAQQAVFAINGHHGFQAAACNQGTTCNHQQAAGIQWWP